VDDNPRQTENLVRGESDVERRMNDLLLTALGELEAPDEQYERYRGLDK